MSTIERLEKWKSGHKSRSVSINIDDGYGATCWTVELTGKEKKKVHASEVSFWVQKDSAGKPIPPPEHVVFVIDGESDEDWPGLEKTINAALDRAEKLGL